MLNKMASLLQRQPRHVLSSVHKIHRTFSKTISHLNDPYLPPNLQTAADLGFTANPDRKRDFTKIDIPKSSQSSIKTITRPGRIGNGPQRGGLESRRGERKEGVPRQGAQNRREGVLGSVKGQGNAVLPREERNQSIRVC